VLGRAIEVGDAIAEQWASYGLAQTELLAGNYRRASDLSDVVLDIADQTGLMSIPASIVRAHVDAMLGTLGPARASIGTAIAAATAAAEATHQFSAHVALGMIELCAGDVAAAALAYGEARRLATRLGLRHATALRALLNEAETAATAGDLDQAEDALASFATAVAGAPPPWSDSIARLARAAMLVARGDVRAAQHELQGAPDDETVLPFDRGRVLLSLGIASRRLRDISSARDALGRAQAIFTEIGAPTWVERAQRELQRLPGRRSKDHGVLTDAEARIAELVAAGRSNRDVATALFVSVKTVEVTLTRVYQKVGVRSRAELAHRWERSRAAD
jgi:DNA-binding CsgD family transcriptional regulator